MMTALVMTSKDVANSENLESDGLHSPELRINLA